MQPLPIDSLLPEIIASLRTNPNLVIEAAPGAGKTTRVPPALLDARLAEGGEVWVLEPRRLAARMAAQRVADERGERLGETVGYQVRFSDVSSAKTRMRFLTEGIFTRRLLSDPKISKAKVVILDEFHERHLQTDLALALLKRLQQTARKDLKMVVMSATLDVESVSKFLGGCPTLHSKGRMFDVAVEHQKHHDARPLEEQISSALRRLIDEGLNGDVLVFLPGAAEIRKAREACAALAKHDLLLLPLHGELSKEEQDRAINPSEKRKVILSTNVAETSITIDGVVAVIDSGLARIASHSPWTGLQVVEVSRISKASAIQRTGRAGRTREGKCFRLYTQQDFNARADYETPEIERLDLTQTVLELHAAGITDLRNLEWFAAPSTVAIETAETLLKKLSALDEKEKINEIGKAMLRYPLPPRLARVITEAEKENVASEACLIAALISERDIRQTQIFGEKKNTDAVKIGSSDLFVLYDLFIEAERANFSVDKMRRMNLDSRAAQSVRRVSGQISRSFEKRDAKELTLEQEKKLSHALLAGFPDRVAQRRGTKEAKERSELLLANGDVIQLGQTSVVRRADFLIAVDVEQRDKTYVRLASAIEPDWLLDLFTDSISETQELFWNEKTERVESVNRLKYEELVLDESRRAAKQNEETETILIRAILNAGLEKFIERETLANQLSRIKFVAQTFAEEEFPLLTEEDAFSSLINLSKGKTSFAEIREAVKSGWFDEEFFGRLNDAQKKLLSKAAPERVKLAGGRQVKIRYEENQPPWIESRLQDFFGMTETPKIADGRVSLVVRLLAPNNRPIQITSDLAGFWQRDYARVRRELSRRYPRHAWNEDPLQPLSAKK